MSTLGSIIARHGGLIQTGPFGSQLKQEEYSETGVPVVMPTNIRNGQIDTSSIARIPASKAQELSRHFLKEGSIVFPRRGDIGKCALITKGDQEFICGTGCLKIEIPPEAIDPHFLYYFLIQPKLTDWLEKNAVGSTMLNLNSSIVGRIEFPDIEIGRQKQLSKILRSYDELIENNRKRIKLLEDSARLLYQEWFVHLRFPGHEHVKIIAGIPEGWTREPLNKLLTLQRGFDLPLDKRKDGKVPIYASTGVNGFHSEAKVPAPGVVTGRSGSLGTVMYVSKDFWPLNTTLWVKEFKKSLPIFSTLLLRSMRLESYNGGAAVPTLNRNDVHKVEVLCPERSIMQLFEDYAKDLFSQIKKMDELSAKLSEGRDLLLPRLMIGEIAA